MAGSPIPEPARDGRATALASVAVAVIALLVYRTTLLPGVYAWDTAEAQTVLPLLGTMHPTGFPAYVLLGWVASIVLAPLGEPAFRVNLLSAILVAGAAGTTVLLLRRLAVPLPVAVAGAAGLALTPVTWAIASAADAHALHLLLLALIVLALVRWAGLVDRRDAGRDEPRDEPGAARAADRALVVAAALFGVGAANHGLTLLLVPAVGLYVVAVDPGVVRRPRMVAACLGASLGVAALLYLELPLRAGPFPAALVYGHPDTWSGFWEIVLARQFQGSVVNVLADPLAALADLGRFALGQLGVLAVLVPPAFVVTCARFPRYALLSGVATLVTCLFAGSYLNAQIGRYYLGPALFAWSWLAIAAAAIVEGVLDRARRPRPDGAMPAADDEEDGAEDPLDTPVPGARVSARTSVALALALALLVPTAVALEPRWSASDRSLDTSTVAWLDDAMAAMDPDAVVVSFWTTSTTLWYGTLVEGRRPDLLVIDDSDIVYDDLGSVEDVIDRYLGVRPVLVIRAEPADYAELAVRYRLEPVGRPSGVYRVTGRVETAP